MNRKEKAELIETLQSTFNASSAVVVAHQVGMTVAESGDLRQKMREAGAGLKVTKNRIAKLALKGTRYEDLDSILPGPPLWERRKTRWQLPRSLQITPREIQNHHRWQHGRRLSTKLASKRWRKCLLLTNCVANLSGLSKRGSQNCPGFCRLRPAKWLA